MKALLWIIKTFLILITIVTIVTYFIHKPTLNVVLFNPNYTTIFKKQEYKRQVSVLFVGNSLTYVNNLPAHVKYIARHFGYNIDYYRHAPPDKKLHEHTRDAHVQSKIAEQKWDYIVLQGHSQLPALSRSVVTENLYKPVGRLINYIRSHQDNAHVVLFQTWAHKNGDPANKHYGKGIGTYEGMQGRLNFTYQNLAKKNKAYVAPVGMVWQKVRELYPDIELYESHNHPSPLGTYLAACVFYTTFFGAPVQGAPVPWYIDEDSALRIQAVSDYVLLAKNRF